MADHPIILDNDAIQRYKDKIQQINNLDPYTMDKSLFSSNPADFPNIEWGDIINYLVFGKSAYTLEDFKAFKGLEAYNQFICNWIKSVEVAKVAGLCVIIGKVVTGGHYDIDATLEAPSGQVLYRGIKKQSDSFTWTAEQTGVYRLCFSNEFSTFSHKLVYLDFVVGEEKPLPGIAEHLTAMTKLETASSNIHQTLNTINDYQTHHRLMESQGRRRAEDLNARVMYYSLGETILVVIIGLSQVLILRNFFSDKKGSST